MQEKLYTFIDEFSVGDKWPDSDHCPINFSFNIKKCINENIPPCTLNNLVNKYSRFYWDDEKSDEFTTCLLDETGCEYLDEFYYSIFNLDAPQVVCDKFNEYIIQACERSLKKSKTVCRTSKFPINPWFDAECKQAKAAYHEAQRATASTEYLTELERDYKRLIQLKKRNFMSQNLSDIVKCKNPKELWAKLNELKGCVKTYDNKDLNLDSFFNHFSKPAIDNTDNCFDFDLVHAAECQDFFDKFACNSNYTCTSGSSTEDDLISHLMNSSITLDEVVSAINALTTSSNVMLLFIKCEMRSSSVELPEVQV